VEHVLQRVPGLLAIRPGGLVRVRSSGPQASSRLLPVDAQTSRPEALLVSGTRSPADASIGTVDRHRVVEAVAVYFAQWCRE